MFQRAVLSKLSRVGGLRPADVAGNAQSANVRRSLCILKARGMVESFEHAGRTYWRRAASEPITAAECRREPELGRLGG